jgi:hypothetical protein
MWPAPFRWDSTRSLWLGAALAVGLLLTTLATAQSVVWDDFNTHVWTIGIENSKDMQRVERGWIRDGARRVLHIQYVPGEATSNYILAFTNLLSPQTLSGVNEIRFELKWDQRPAQAALKLEAKHLLHPYRHADESLIFAQNVPLRTGGYQEYRVPLQVNASFSRILFVFDNMPGAPSDIYLDNLRFVRDGQEFVWDSFDHPSRFWVPFGSWLSWAGPMENPPLEMITMYEGFPGGPSGALFLRWDSGPGSRDGMTTEIAEVKTEGNSFEILDRGLDPPGLNADLSAFTTMSADVVATNRNSLGVFFGHYLEGTTTIERGFITSGVRVMTLDEPQRVAWDIPWPPSFPAEDVDIVAFVVHNTNVPELAQGTLRLDNVTLHRPDFLPPDETHAKWTLSHFDFDARDDRVGASDRSGMDPKMHFLAGDIGEFSSDNTLTAQTVEVRHDPTQSAHVDGAPGASLRLNLDLSQVDFAGEFVSLFGRSDFKETSYTLDLTQFSQLQLSLRPGDANPAPIWLRIEVKDHRDLHEYTAYRYVQIPAAPAAWQRIVLDADITNAAQWRFNRFPPDPTRAKLLILVTERFFNAEHFTFYLDELRLIHKIDMPFNLDAALASANSSSDGSGVDALLHHVQQKAWLHFDRWVVDGVATNPDLYLFFDRSNYPDLISTAAVGFGLAATAVAHRHGWIGDSEATSRVLRVLRTFADGPMIDDPSIASLADIDNSIGVKGWFWHFLERDGTRKRKTDAGLPLATAQKSELSSVDTAIFLWGALAARDYFASTDPEINPIGPSPQAAEIIQLVDRIYRRIDFPFFRRSKDTPPKQGQIYLAWKPEKIDGGFAVSALDAPDGKFGYFSGTPEYPSTWDRNTDEIVMILLLGAVSPNPQFRLPASIFPLQDYLLHQSPTGFYTTTCGNPEVVGPVLHSYLGSSFTYFFLQNFFKADHHLEPLLGINLFRNAQRAARASWLYSRCGASTHAPTFHGNVFGFSAADGRDGKYHGEWGAPPREAAYAQTDDGTVPIYSHLGLLPLWPDDFHDPERVAYRNPSIDALVTLFKEGRIFDDAMGFGDAINRVPEPGTELPFYNMVTFGIDNGPIVMGIENERTGLFWRLNLLCRELAAAGIRINRTGFGSRVDPTGCLATLSSVQQTSAEPNGR